MNIFLTYTSYCKSWTRPNLLTRHTAASWGDPPHLVVNPQTNQLCQEGACEPCLNEQGVPHGTLVQTLPNYLAGKKEVFQLPTRRPQTRVVWMNLEVTVIQCILIDLQVDHNNIVIFMIVREL